MPRPDPTPTEVRRVAVFCLLAEVVFLAWRVRNEWRIAVPALLLIHLLGLVGFGLYWLVARRWRQQPTHEELMVSSGLFSALIVLGVTYLWGEWMGAQSVIGSLTGGALVGVTLVLGRLAIWGPLPKA